MVVQDRVYSNFEITDKIAVELINSKTFQRLKGINQFGLPDDYYHLAGFSRYDHSIGVYILLNKLGAPEEEQLAGLLHDISHTAFSHLVDWLIGDPQKEDFQDSRHLGVLKQSEIKDILEKNGFFPEQMADYHKLPLLEREIPYVCADRVDYVLRESDPVITKLCLPNMKVVDNEIVFSSEEAALLFADNFLDKQKNHWGGYEAVTRYILFSSLLKQAIDEKIISINDLMETDGYVIDKLIRLGKNDYLEILNLLKNKSLDFLPKSKSKVKKKFRYVDPKVYKNGKLFGLSELNGKFRVRVDRERQKNADGVFPGERPKVS